MTSTSAPKTILLKGDPVAKEAVADAAITPGMLIERMSTGNVRAHATSGGVKPSPMFAREEEYVGGAIDTAYAEDDQCPFWFCRPGDEIYALVPASAAAIAIGDLLMSAGDGTLIKAASYLTDNTAGTANTTLQALADGSVYATDVGAIRNDLADLAAAVNRLHPGAIARALEAVDNSGGGAAVRIKIEVL